MPTKKASCAHIIDETLRRRSKQMKYNEEHGITPTQIKKALNTSLVELEKQANGQKPETSTKKATVTFAADPIIERMTRQQLEKSINETTRLMKEAAKNLDFERAMELRDILFELKSE